MGNICRSPAAEGMMRHLVEGEGLSGQIECASAGTIGYHAGGLPDHRMRSAAAERGIQLHGTARQIRADDLEEFDLILTMDDENLANVRRLDRDAKFAHKIRPFCDFLTYASADEVPDPYYGGARGFEQVLDLLEDGCAGLLEHVKGRLEG